MKRNALIVIKWIISFIDFILCIVLLCFVCPRVSGPDNLGFDYIGVIVGILSLLVTLLIGWNIYSTIDIKEQIQSIKNNTNRTQEETMARAYISIMNQTSYKVEGREDNDDCYNAIANGLFACKHFHLAGKIKDRDELISMIAGFKKEKCTLSLKQRNNIRIIIGQLKSVDMDVSKINEWLDNYESVVEGRKGKID